MEVKHYATISVNKNIVPTHRTKQVKSSDVMSLKLPKEAFRVVTFDRLVDVVEYNGKKYPMATKRLNQKLYHIGSFASIDSLSNKDPLFIEVAKHDGCIGIVTSPAGFENLVLEGEGIINPMLKEKGLIKECTARPDEIFKDIKASDAVKTKSVKKATAQEKDEHKNI